MIIDFHTHAFPDTLAPRAIGVLTEKSGLKPTHDGTAQGLVSNLDKNGIDKAVVLSIATKATQENSVNTFAISMLDNPRLIPFGSVFPGSETWSYQLDRLADAGIKGIKLHPEYQGNGFFIDSDEAIEIFKKCGKLGLIVQFHSGEDEAYPPPAHATPLRVNRICEFCPETRYVAAHMGGYNMWDEFLRDLEPHENLWLDASQTRTAHRINDDTAKAIISKMGPDHILFASDAPWEDEADSLKGLLGLGLSDEDNQKILWKNAVKLLNLKV